MKRNRCSHVDKRKTLSNSKHVKHRCVFSSIHAMWEIQNIMFYWIAIFQFSCQIELSVDFPLWNSCVFIVDICMTIQINVS